MHRQASMTRERILPRHEQHDLGLSPREEVRCASGFSEAFRALLSRSAVPNNLFMEVGEEARKRAGLGAAPRDVLTIPTSARMWAPASRLDVQQRDASTAGTGAYLVATENLSFIDLLRNRSVVLAMGATKMSGLQGNVTIPKQTAGATAYWLASETTAITEGNQTFAQVSLTPRTVGAVTDISRLLQLQSSPQTDALVAADLAKSVATAVDLAAIAGTGTEQPTGIINTASVGAFTGSSLDAAALLNAQTDLGAANALTPSSGYVTTASVASLLMTRVPFSGSTAACWTGNILDGTCMGLRAMSSAQVPSATMILGTWSDCIIGEWGVLEISVSNSAEAGHFAKGISTLRAMFTCDVIVRNAASFSVATSIT